MYKTVNEYIIKIHNTLSKDEFLKTYQENGILGISFISEIPSNDHIEIRYKNKIKTIYGEKEILNSLKNTFKMPHL